MSKWREFRQELFDLEASEQLKQVAKWFAQCPTSNYSIDWDNPASWPTPWELLHEGTPCLTGVAYLMERTLNLVGWDSNRLVLTYVNDTTQEDTRMLLVVDGQHVLNYNLADVEDFDTLKANVVTLVRYKSSDKGYARI
jgi:hypothetical protein